VRVEIDFVNPFKLIWVVQSRAQKIPLCFLTNSMAIAAHPASIGGALRVVTDVERGMRWMLHVVRRMTLRADGEVVWYQCRRFEVPAEIAASPNRNFKSKAALESWIC